MLGASSPSEDDESFVDLAGTWALAHGELGYLDWVSGAIRVGITKGEWDSLIALGPGPLALRSRPARLAATFTHERFHLIQVISTGFLFRTVSDLAEEVRSMLDLPARDPGDALVAAIERIKQGSLRTSERYHAILGALDESMSVGVTTRQIVEGAAFVFEHRNHRPFLTATDYRALVLDALSDGQSEYRRAFDMAADMLGDQGAYDQLPILAFAALHFQSPPLAFVLCLANARELRTKQWPPANALEWLRELVAPLKLAYLGTAGHVIERQDTLEVAPHPELSRGVVNLRYAAQQRGRESVVELMADPTLWQDPDFRNGLGPIWPPTILDGPVVHFGSDYRPELSLDEKVQQQRALSLLTWISSRLEGSTKMFRHLTRV